MEVMVDLETEASGANVKGTLVDFDGNRYPTVQIGNQIWMASNLKVRHFRDGTPIRSGWDTPLKQGSKPIPLRWDLAEVPPQIHTRAFPVSVFYNWDAVGSGKLAPEGWHVPTDPELEEMLHHCGGWEQAGRALKASSLGGSDLFGFGAQATGHIDDCGEVMGCFPPDHAAFWTATGNFDTGRSWGDEGGNFTLVRGMDGVGKFHAPMTYGLTVRCIKDPS
jgi:uncharacterized protein (TIGR02145 family)